MTTLEALLKEKKITAYTLARDLSPSGLRSASFIRAKIKGKIPMSMEDLESICKFAGLDKSIVPFDTERLKVV